jgi:hypothetical protein
MRDKAAPESPPLLGDRVELRPEVAYTVQGGFI